MGQQAFIDYYEILQLSHLADEQTIERVYRLLARRYHPDNLKTGDAQKFITLMEAHQVLADPEKRASYDAKYEAGHSHQWEIFYDGSPSQGAGEDRKIFQAILSMLYAARRRDAEKAGVGVYQLEKLLGVPEKHLEFHLWYLREKGWIQRVESGGFAVTAAGVDVIMEKDLPLKRDRLLPPLDTHKAPVQ